MNKLLSVFMSEDGKNLSSQRFIAVIVCLLWSFVISIGWLVLTIKTGSMVIIPDSLIGISSSSMGIALGAKVLNSVLSETKNEKKETIQQQ
jgi:uncharacterized membrane protein SpoIIM required for sporulation